jgi:hypothetical protein
MQTEPTTRTSLEVVQTPSRTLLIETTRDAAGFGVVRNAGELWFSERDLAAHAERARVTEELFGVRV